MTSLPPVNSILARVISDFRDLGKLLIFFDLTLPANTEIAVHYPDQSAAHSSLILRAEGRMGASVILTCTLSWSSETSGHERKLTIARGRGDSSTLLSGNSAGGSTWSDYPTHTSCVSIGTSAKFSSGSWATGTMMAFQSESTSGCEPAGERRFSRESETGNTGLLAVHSRKLAILPCVLRALGHPTVFQFAHSSGLGEFIDVRG